MGSDFDRRKFLAAAASVAASSVLPVDQVQPSTTSYCLAEDYEDEDEDEDEDEESSSLSTSYSSSSSIISCTHYRGPWPPKEPLPRRQP